MLYPGRFILVKSVLLGISKVCSGSMTLVFVPFLMMYVVLGKFSIDQVILCTGPLHQVLCQGSLCCLFVEVLSPGSYPGSLHRFFVQVLCSCPRLFS